MYRILIVDDEKIERNGIKFLLKQMGFQLEVLEAQNGKKAVEMLENEKVDILLTDIKMPFMDGMELIRTIHGRYEDMKIIIFSGFSDFEYARTAMKYEVKDYILKPVEPNEFKNTMNRVMAEINEQALKQELLDKSQEFLLDHLLYSLVNGASLEEIEKKAANMVDTAVIRGFCQMILIEFTEDFFGRRDQGFVEVIKDYLGEEIHYLNLNPQQSVVFLNKKLDNPKETGKDLWDAIKRGFVFDCHIAISKVLENVEEISNAMEPLERVMENKFFQTQNFVYLVEEQEGNFAGQMEEDTLFKQMKQDIKMKDIPALKEHFGWVCEKYRDKTEYSQVYVKFVFSNLLKDFYDNLPDGERGFIDREIDRLYRATDFGAVKEIIDESIAKLESVFSVNPQMAHRELEAVKKYIYEHFSEELSTEILAKQVYLSPGYLSALFKKETKQNLSKFIKEYRMEKAKDMLENTHMKIVQVSEAVGYPNVSYFCQNFREYFGISPQKFRNQGEEVTGENEEMGEND